MSRDDAELLYRILCLYVDELVKATLTRHTAIKAATFECLAELVCLQVEIKVRRMVKTLNRKMRAGEFEELRRLIRENPEVARKAAKYVARRLKHRVRHIIEGALSQKLSA